MKLNSKYFDSIRVKPDASAQAQDNAPGCHWPGCKERGDHRAPKGRGRDGEYFLFCLDHVRDYNKSYNYFSGMSDEEVANFQKSAVTGHRPTWSVGVNSARASSSANGAARNGVPPNSFTTSFSTEDVLGILGAPGSTENRTVRERQRPIRNLERKSLNALNLDDTATREEIKARFKSLVKRHHPDLNGGDRASEDKLRKIIQAYSYLKQSGLC